MDTKVKKITDVHPEFAIKYPTLLQMCSSASTMSEQESVKSILGTMFQQLESRPTGDDLHRASVAVGQLLGDVYLPK